MEENIEQASVCSWWWITCDKYQHKSRTQTHSNVMVFRSWWDCTQHKKWKIQCCVQLIRDDMHPINWITTINVVLCFDIRYCLNEENCTYFNILCLSYLYTCKMYMCWLNWDFLSGYWNSIIFPMEFNFYLIDVGWCFIHLFFILPLTRGFPNKWN